MLDTLIISDVDLLLLINSYAGRWPWLDDAMMFASSRAGWIPLYALLLFLVIKRYGFRGAGWVVVISVLTVIITDQGSVLFFKDVFQRPRPCHVPEVMEQLNLVSGKCGGSYGFISSHAANVFGLSTALMNLLKDRFRMVISLFGWALLVSVSRCYLGVHYPSDIVVGCLFGVVVGFSVSKVGKRALLP